jgi:hypothetical protein
MDTDHVPAGLADRLGPNATLELVELLGATQRECMDMTMRQAAERFERRLVEETSKLRVEMHHEIGGLRAEMHQRFGAMESRMSEGFSSVRRDMAEQKVELIKWSFAFWFAQFAATAGLFATLLRMAGR